MLTEDTKICTADYWAKVYNGTSNGVVDSSHNKRHPNSFDRFKWLADVVEGPDVLDIASGHAVTCKRIIAMHPNWKVVASDQTRAAMKAAQYNPYYIFNAYDVPLRDNSVTTLTISQALEYLEYPDRFMRDTVKRLAKYFVCTVPDGEMKLWSQLRIYEEHSFKEWLSGYGKVVHFDKVQGLMLAKVEL